MTHLVLDKITSYSKGHTIPPQIQWFFEGWNGVKFRVNAGGRVYPDFGLGGIPNWQAQAKYDQAWRMADTINTTVVDMFGWALFIEKCLDSGYVKWVEDEPTEFVDNQPDDYIDPHPMTKFGCDHDVT